MKKVIRHKLSELPKEGKTNWERVDAISESELIKNALSDLDTFIADGNFWQKAKLLDPAPHKERITMYLDDDVLNWLRNMGPGYQPRINKILRTCMQAYRKDSKKRKTG